MAIDADTLLDRVYLKQQISRWRNIAIIGFLLCGIILFADTVNVKEAISTYVARVKIEGIITQDDARNTLFSDLISNNAIEAVIFEMESPGGTAVGGEELHRLIKKLSAEKPVVIQMSNLCASACYMAAVAGDHVIAREGTITGSIGVVVQAFEATELAKKMGIEPVIIKSAPLKATPNPLEKVTSSQRAQIQDVIDDFFTYFKNLVKEERKLSDDVVNTIADGRVFSGRKALELGLIDEVGGYDEAKAWLAKNHEIPEDISIRTVKPKKERQSLLEELMQGANTLSEKTLPLTLDGMLLIWQPASQ